MPGQPIAPNKFFVEPGDGRRLCVRSWRPTGEARAQLAVIPGFRSRREDAARFGRAMTDHGIAAHVLDLRGHGESAGSRFGVRDFIDYVSDIEAMIPADGSNESPPRFLLGQGAGAVAAGLFALAHRDRLAGLICEGIALETTPARRLFAALVRLAPGLPPLRTHAALARASAQLRGALANLSSPLLVLHGAVDAVAPSSGSETLHELAGSRDKTLQIFEGYHHDLINDPGHEQVFERIRQWIETRSGPGQRHQIGIEYINTDP